MRAAMKFRLKTTQDDPVMGIRTPREMRRALQTAADANARTLSAEVLTRLAESLEAEPDLAKAS